MTTTLIAAAASPWLAPMIDLLAATSSVTLWAPWLVPTFIPAAAARLWQRRVLAATANVSELVTSAPWFAAQTLPHLWARNSRMRALQVGLVERRALAWWTTQRLQRKGVASPAGTHETPTLAACSLAAREPFAWAKARGIHTTLLVDVPHYAALHRDLDAAALRFPDDRYLRHFRAPAWAIARQHAEFELADRIIVRGTYAASTIGVRSARRAEHIEVCSIISTGPFVGRANDRNAPLLLAGPAAARGGFAIAADAAAQLGRRLLAKANAATEPHYRQHPAVDWISDEDSGIPSVAAIVAPALCEAFLQVQPAPGLAVIGSEKCTGITRSCLLDAGALAAAVANELG